jgi:hypothetical protein
MNENTLFDVCDAFGLRSGPAYSGGDKWGPHVSISCPLAGKNHGDPDDWNCSCSVSVSDDEPSLAKCFSFNCAFTGSFFRMLEDAARYRGSPPNLMKVLEALAPTEKFTLEAIAQRSKKHGAARAEIDRRPTIKNEDRDVMAEGRFGRYASSIPQYALQRGLLKETCKAWGLGNDKERKCLVFPVRRYDGKLIGMTGRYVHYPNSPTKYHNYAGLNKSRYLYGEHMLKHKSPIIVCEGQIDAILTWQHLGIPTVASLGEGFGAAHAKTIAAYEPPVVYLFFDNDAAGRMAAEKVEYQLRGRVAMKLMIPPVDMDPGELSKEQAQQAFNSAIPITPGFEWTLDLFLSHTSLEQG